jgi:hypothetical protein
MKSEKQEKISENLSVKCKLILPKKVFDSSAIEGNDQFFQETKEAVINGLKEIERYNKEEIDFAEKYVKFKKINTIVSVMILSIFVILMIVGGTRRVFSCFIIGVGLYLLKMIIFFIINHFYYAKKFNALMISFESRTNRTLQNLNEKSLNIRDIKAELKINQGFALRGKRKVHKKRFKLFNFRRFEISIVFEKTIFNVISVEV